jgi:hypothetical protein
VYIWLGYGGKKDTESLLKFVLFDAAFILVGGVAGVIEAIIGNWLKGKYRKQ